MTYNKQFLILILSPPKLLRAAKRGLTFEIGLTKGKNRFYIRCKAAILEQKTFKINHLGNQSFSGDLHWTVFFPVQCVCIKQQPCCR